ncbi:GFA family protein [Pseudoalteromonas xiamenensis]
MYHGSCLCGEVKIVVSGKIESIIHCHCSQCRKSTGSAYATNGFVAIDDFQIIQGVGYLKFFELKSGRRRHFCSVCASPVYSSNSSNPTRVRLRLGLLDTDIVERPISHNFVTSKANWDEVETNLPCFEGHEPSR